MGIGVHGKGYYRSKEVTAGEFEPIAHHILYARKVKGFVVQVLGVNFIDGEHI